MNQTIKTVAAVAARAALAGVISTVVLGAAVWPAAAQTVDVQTRLVSTAGLNLASPGGQAALMQRLRVAARHVCQDSGGGPGVLSSAFDDCTRTAFAGAQAQANAMITAAGNRAVVASNAN